SVAAKFMRVPHIMTAHDVLLDRQFRGIRGKIKRYVIGLIFYLIDILMAVGDDAKENLAQNYPRLLSRGSLLSIRNGINVAKFKSHTRRDLRLELGLDQGVELI